MKILFVCLGNICRSPMAEAIFQHKTSQLDWITDSAGTGNYHIGERPDHRTLKVLADNNINTNHRAQQLQNSHFIEYDRLIAMDHSNYQDMLDMAGNQLQKVLLMRDYDPEGRGANVPDPYYGDFTDFQKVFEILDRSIDELIIDLRSNNALF